MKCRLSYKAPTIEEYKELRELVNWKPDDDETTQKMLDNSYYHDTVRDKENSTLIGHGSIILIDECFFEVYDVIVKDQYQHQGIGTNIMNRIIKVCQHYADNCTSDGIKVMLKAAKARNSFYEKFGFRTVGEPYHMSLFLRKTRC